jgi:hypothetical protein
MRVTEVTREYELVVVGGGMPGICAAVQAARLGVETALINDRGYLGGNASAEINVRVAGATEPAAADYNFAAREGGLVEEILLEDLERNPTGNRYIWDALLRDVTDREEALDVYLETTVDEVELDERGEIRSVSGTQDDAERRIQFYGDYFLDDTGDGTVGDLAGADYRMGREASDEYGERLAPEEADDYVIPSTLTWYTKDVGEPVEYEPPDFAMDIPETGALEHRSIPESGFGIQWYYELGGDRDQIDEAREIVRDHQALVYGIWDHIKNSGEYDAETYDLEYVSCIPGKRESRRLLGDHVLTEGDVVEQVDFEDTVAHGGWTIDLHAPRGFFSEEKKNEHVQLKGIYKIPYRCGYSRNVSNLFMAGRCMSTSHVAFGTTRVMATLSTLGQALGAAAHLCVEAGTTPRGVYENHRDELQQLLLRENQYVVGVPNEDPDDMAPDASITAATASECALTDRDGAFQLDEPALLVLPCAETVEDVSLLVQTDAATTLEFDVYCQAERFSYYPEDHLTSGEVALDAHDEFTWVDLPVDVEAAGNAITVEIAANDDITLGTTDRRLPGVVSTHTFANDSDRMIDIETLEPVERRVGFLEENFCFRTTPGQPVYEPDRVVDGYHRPHGLPHAWVSEPGSEQWIEFTFEEPRPIEELRLYFDTNYRSSLFHHRYQDRDAPPSLVEAYTVSYRTDGSWERIERVEDNHQRLNCVSIGGVEADALRVEFESTHGAEIVTLYEARIY